MRETTLLGGGHAELVGGAMCLADVERPVLSFNRAMPLGAAVDVDAIESWYGDHPPGYVIGVTPDRPELEAELVRRGYLPSRAWQKFVRDAAPAARPETAALRIEETLDADAFSLAVTEGFGMPPHLRGGVAALVGSPGWHCFVAWADDEPAAGGALYVEGALAWLGAGATRRAYRGRGGQGALLAARIERAREAGAATLTTETGLEEDDSARNILRAGFRAAYRRAHWKPR